MHDLTPVYEGLNKLRKVIDKMEADLKEASLTDDYLKMAKAFIQGNVSFSAATERCESSGKMTTSLLDNNKRGQLALWLLSKMEDDDTPQEQEQPETNSVTP